MTDENNEVRVFGPPGTGKTTWLAARLSDTARARGTSAIIAASFTRTAAAEMAGRGLPIPREQVGTLHSLAYRSIERPPVAEERIDGWNSRNPNYRLTPGATAGEDAVEVHAGQGHGDTLMRQADHCRARLLAEDLWPREVHAFYQQWRDWKADEGVIDYSDMIEMALRDTDEAPGSPLVGFFDEVQDFTPLELALVRKWGRRMERVILAGDDDQCIYDFKGATPDAFLDPPIDAAHKRILDQSYRVPRAVHAAASQWVDRLTRREPKDYLPRDAAGSVRIADHNYSFPEPLADEIGQVLETGKTVMVLGACSYMIDPLKHRLRHLGLPFHNPYRRSRGDWNPLTPSRGVSASERLVSYLIIDERLFGDRSHLWTGDDLRNWASIVKATGVFKRGAKKLIDKLGELGPEEVPYDDIAALFVDDTVLDSALEPSLDWFRSHLLETKQQPMAFPLKVAERLGPATLLDEPKLIIGTIHSVKGGQADVVYLFPDLSMSAAREWGAAGEHADSIVRQMYVGMTRAREDLILCTPVHAMMSVDPQVLAGVAA